MAFDGILIHKDNRALMTHLREFLIESRIGAEILVRDFGDLLILTYRHNPDEFVENIFGFWGKSKTSQFVLWLRQAGDTYPEYNEIAYAIVKKRGKKNGF